MKRLSLTGLVLLGAVGCTHQYDAEVTGMVKESYCLPDRGDRIENLGGEVIREGDAYKYNLTDVKRILEDGTSSFRKDGTVYLFLGENECNKSSDLKIPAGEWMYARGMVDLDFGYLQEIEEIRQLTPEERQVWPREK